MVTKNNKYKKGFVLMSGLIFLMILTIIGIASMGSSAISQNMTKNLRDLSISFTAADSALSQGETWIENQTALPSAVTACTTSPCAVWNYGTLGTFYQNGASWWQTNGTPFSGSFGGVALQPYYIIEQYSFVPYELSPNAESKGQGFYYYRVTAFGTGATSPAYSVVQSIVATIFN